MAGELDKFHAALDDIRSIADFIEAKADAYHALFQPELADEFWRAAEMLRKAQKEIGGSMTEEIQRHLHSQQLGQSMLLTTLVHLGKANQVQE